MPTANRSEGRNVHVFDASRPDEELGGLIVNEGTALTNEIFLAMLDVLILPTASYEVWHRDSDTMISRTDDPLQRGEYEIRGQGPIQLNRESVLSRAFSHAMSGRDGGFSQRIRERDGRCVITHTPNILAYRGIWAGFEAAHIFPRAFESHFNPRWITNRDEGETGIDSTQNGMLLDARIHQLWDSYLITVDPDHDYVVISFIEDLFRVESNRLDSVCRQPGDDRAVRDDILRWHFRQAILTNMRGAGEPIFEHDFPSGSDMIGQIRSGPRAAERMEFELFSRLVGFSEQ